MKGWHRMSILVILCLIHGVQSAALKGTSIRLHTQAAPALLEEEPTFVANGLLTPSVNMNAAAAAAPSAVHSRRHWVSAEDHTAIKDECVKACGKGMDSSCVPECQVRLYSCLDYDRKVPEGAKKYEECEAGVLKTYTKFSETWEATHPYVSSLVVKSNGAVTATDFDQAEDECVDACGKGVDSSCVPECQVKMYACLDNDRKTEGGKEKYKECEKEVLATYTNFAKDWDATHPYLLAIGRHTSARELRVIRDECVTDCGSKCSKSCAPMCQTNRYNCLQVDASQGMQRDTVSKTEATAKTADELAAVEKACTKACGLGSDASCLPECAVQMYSCKDSACTEKIIKSYETFAIAYNEAHPFLIASRGHADAETLEEMRDGCAEACGHGVDSSCVPECQVKMYACVDHDRKTDDGAKKYSKCTEEVLAKYEKFADDWSATHPYLLAVHRHVSSVELVQVHDKCHEACGGGVDSSCVPECQVEVYSCLDHDRKTKDGAKLYEECESKAIAEYKEFGKKWDEKHPY